METAAVLIFLAFLVVLLLLTIRRATVYEYQRGLLYTRGKFHRILLPGEHWYIGPIQTILKVDARTLAVTIPGQEVLTADNVSIKISLAATYRISDPYLVMNQVANYQEAFYQILQLHLRDIVGALAVDDLLASRQEIGRQLFERAAPQAAEIGVELLMANMKDIMFPGELKNIFAQVVNARKEGLAALERARGESAALRNLANAARLLDGNPNLRQLRLFQVLEHKSGSTVVFMPPEGVGISGIPRTACATGVSQTEQEEE